MIVYTLYFRSVERIHKFVSRNQSLTPNSARSWVPNVTGRIACGSVFNQYFFGSVFLFLELTTANTVAGDSVEALPNGNICLYAAQIAVFSDGYLNILMWRRQLQCYLGHNFLRGLCCYVSGSNDICRQNRETLLFRCLSASSAALTKCSLLVSSVANGRCVAVAASTLVVICRKRCDHYMLNAPHIRMAYFDSIFSLSSYKFTLEVNGILLQYWLAYGFLGNNEETERTINKMCLIFLCSSKEIQSRLFT